MCLLIFDLSIICPAFLILLHFTTRIHGYYDSYQCYATGDCIILLTTGGHADDQHRWNTECHDGEGLVGILDTGGDYQGFSYSPSRKKPPSLGGIYPYYDWCNIRDISLKEYYCYDRYYPVDTYDTFVTAVSSSQFYPGGISVSNSYKCCRLPFGYHFDYGRCEYKYTHDRWGEHYDSNYWLVKCDENFLMTGIGQADNPWTNAQHYTWIQCCPVFYDPDFIVPLPPPNRTRAAASRTESTTAQPAVSVTTPQPVAEV